MLKLNVAVILALTVATVFSSCKKTGPTGPAGPTGATGPTGPTHPADTGIIFGHAGFIDQYGSKILTGLNTMSLSLSGATAINPDSTGYFIFPPVATGSYYINASATGYASTHVNNFQYVLDTVSRDVKLSVIPSFSPLTFVGYATAGPLTGDSLIVTFNPDTRARNCIIFLNNNATVNGQPSNYLLSYVRGINATTNLANPTKVQFTVPAQDLHDAGFASGSTVYYAVYGYVVNDASVYEDLTTGKNVYNAISASPLTTTGVTP